MRGSEPPPAARALLGRVLPASDRDEVLADLAELFASRVRTKGARAARWWYRRQAVRTAIAFRRSRSDLPDLKVRSSPGLKARPSRIPGVFMDEVRLAVRRLRARPAASVASIVTLACAIGAVAATWSLLDAVLINPLPVREPERLVVVGSQFVSRGTPGKDVFVGHQHPVYRAIRDLSLFKGLAAGGPWSTMATTDGTPEARTVFFASHDYFTTLGVNVYGRSFSADDDQRAAPLVAILSERFWRRAFGADPNAVGSTISVAGQPVAIVGVAESGFRGLSLDDAPDFYMPLETVVRAYSYAETFPQNFFAEPDTGKSPVAWIEIVGRLPDGATVAEVTDRLNAAADSVSARAQLFSLSDLNTSAVPADGREGISRFTGLLATTVGLLLLVGCLTVGMLLLIRTEARRDEFAMCLALGATRRRLAGSVAIEGALLALAGVALSIPVSLILFDGVRAFELPGRVSIDLLELSLDTSTLAAAGSAGLGATLVMALIAGAFAFPGNAADALRSRGGASPRVVRRRTRSGLVAAQVAVALVLVAGATLFTRSLLHALDLNPGIQTDQVLTASFSPASHGYQPASASQYFENIRLRLIQRPSIAAIGFYRYTGTSPGQNAIVDGTPTPLAGMIDHTRVDVDYFRTIGLPVVRGRGFDGRDREGNPLVGIASASLARQLGPGDSALGRRYASSERRPPIEIVGVVPDLITRVSRLEPVVLYTPLAQDPGQAYLTLVARAAADVPAAMSAITTAARAIDPEVKPGPIQTLDDQMAAQMSPQRFGGIVMGALGAIAVLLTVLGVYVLAESMAIAREKEMSIRAALGASRSHLGGLVLRETTKLVGIGLAAGLGLAWLGAGTIEAFLFQIEPLDVPTLTAISAVLLVLALAVSLRPALSAARVDLARVLRDI